MPDAPGVEREVDTCCFATYNVDDVVARKLRTAVAFSDLLLEVYELKMDGENIYDKKADYIGAFSILDHAPANDHTE